MGAPIISLICPVFKAEAYIKRCIESILAQTMRDWELLLIDDGSPDRSGKICDEYATLDSRIRVLHKANGGVSAARQCGLDMAFGEYVIHVDPDDWMEKDMLMCLYSKASCCNADMVICDYYDDCEGTRKRIRQCPISLDSESVFKELFSNLNGCCWNKLIRRSLFHKFHIRFPQGFVLLEDLFVTARLCLNKIKIAYVPMALYHYVLDENPNTLTRKPTKSAVESIVRFCQYFTPVWEERGMSNLIYTYKFRAKEFAYESRVYGKRELSMLCHDINEDLKREAIRSALRSPRIMEVWMAHHFPRFIGSGYRALVLNIKRIVGKFVGIR